MIGCLGRIVGLVLLIALIWVAWIFGPEISDRFRDGVRGTERVEEPSPELASSAMDRFQQMTEGGDRELSFTGPELESLLRFEFSEYFPEGVGEPTVRFLEGEAVLGVRVPRALLPDVTDLERVLEILPDTVSLQLRGTLIDRGEAEAAFVIRRIDVASIPIPRRYFAPILEGIGVARPPGLPAEAVAVPLPVEVKSARIEGDRLVLSMDRP